MAQTNQVACHDPMSISSSFGVVGGMAPRYGHVGPFHTDAHMTS